MLLLYADIDVDVDLRLSLIVLFLFGWRDDDALGRECRVLLDKALVDLYIKVFAAQAELGDSRLHVFEHLVPLHRIEDLEALLDHIIAELVRDEAAIVALRLLHQRADQVRRLVLVDRVKAFLDNI